MKQTTRHLTALILSTSSPAWAFEGQGGAPPPASGDSPALTLGAPTSPSQGGWAVSSQLTVAGSPLVRTETDGGAPQSTCALCTVAGLGLSGQYGLTDQLAVGLTAPLYPWVQGADSGSPAIGDLGLWVPVTVVRSDAVGVALRPFLTVPTGSSERFLGDGTVGGGLLATAGVTAGVASGVVEAGVDLAGRDVLGIAELRTGIGGYVEVADPLTLGVELRGQTPLAATQPVGSAQELMGLASLSASRDLTVRVGGGAGLTNAPGAAAWRASVGLTYSPGAAQEATPRAATDLVSYFLSDPHGNALRSAEIVLNGEVLGTTDWRGQVELARRLRWADQPVVRARGFQLEALPAPSTGDDRMNVEVPWTPLPVMVRVVDGTGELIDATIEFEGDGTVDPPVRDSVGSFEYQVPSGVWSLTTSAPGYSPQKRTLVIDGGRTEPIFVDAVLTKASDGTGELILTVTDPDGDPIEGALVELGGQLFGTTGSGGDLVVEQLDEGDATLWVSHPGYEDVEPQALELRGSAARPVVMLTHLPGSVEVRVSGPDGSPAAATVSVAGADAALRPVETGNNGRHLWVLGEGVWTMTVTSASLGTQRRSFRVDHSERTLKVIDVLMLPDVGGGTLTVRAFDANGRPVDGAEVYIGGQAVGRTSSYGEVWIDGLAPGPTTLRIVADRVRPYEQTVRLSEEGREVDALLEWLPGTIQVRALGPTGQPIAGEVRATDGTKTVRGTFDLDGEWIDQLPPGDWQVLVSVPELGLQTRSVVVEPDKTTLLTLDYRLAEVAGDGSLALTLLRPDGEPVEGAAVSIDGTPFGTTGTGGSLKVTSLARGARQIVATAAGHQRVELVAQLTGSELAQKVTMPWAEGLVTIAINQGDKPVTDAILRLAGDDILEPVGTDARGEAEVALTPGSWTLLVSSVSAGLHQEELVVPPGTELTRLTVTLERIGTATLLVRVRDEDGLPVQGAKVSVLSGSTASTSSGGGALLSGLLTGETKLVVDAPPPFIDRRLPIDVSEGSEQLSIEVLYPRSPLALRTVDDAGLPLAGVDLLMQGPGSLPVQRTDDDGEASLELRPGTWTAFGRLEELEGSATIGIELETPASMLVTLQAQEMSGATGTFRFDDAVLFDVGKADLKPEAAPSVAALAERLLADASIVLAEVQGHTDDTGTLGVNMELSRRRAQTVLEALVERGVPRERLRARGYAALRPVATGTDEASRQANRRVEVVVTDRSVR